MQFLVRRLEAHFCLDCVLYFAIYFIHKKKKKNVIGTLNKIIRGAVKV